MHADIERKNQLYILDGAVLENIDALNNLDIPLEKEPLLQVLSKLSVLLKANKWESGGDEAKIRNKYTDALLEKYRLAVQELEIIDSDDPHLENYKRIYSKQKRRRFFKVYQSVLIALSMIIGGAYLMALADSPTATLSYTLIFIIALSFIIGVITYIKYWLKKKHAPMNSNKSRKFQPAVLIEEVSQQESNFSNVEEELNMQSPIFFDLNENGRIETRLASIWNKYQCLDYDFINLLYMRENDRDKMLKSDENFIREQLELTYETIRKINPLVIVFFTDYCRYLIFGADRWIDPVTEIDNHYIIRGTNIPVFFSDDITILDTVERGELINKIRKLL